MADYCSVCGMREGHWAGCPYGRPKHEQRTPAYERWPVNHPKQRLIGLYTWAKP